MRERREHFASDFNGHCDAKDFVLGVVFREVAHHMNGEQIFPWFHRMGYIAADLPKHADVRADLDAIQPYICDLGHRIEAEFKAPVGDGARELEIVPVPSSHGCPPIESVSIEAVHLRFVEFVADAFRAGDPLEVREARLAV